MWWAISFYKLLLTEAVIVHLEWEGSKWCHSKLWLDKKVLATKVPKEVIIKEVIMILMEWTAKDQIEKSLVQGVILNQVDLNKE